MVDTFLTDFYIKMQVLIYYIMLGLLLSGTNSFGKITNIFKEKVQQIQKEKNEKSQSKLEAVSRF